MKKRKKAVFVLAVPVVLFGIVGWYLFLGSRITDSSSEIIAGKDGTRSLIVYFSIGRNDEYYGLEPTQEAYDTLHALYEQQGLTAAEIDGLLVLDVKEHGYFTDRGMAGEHGGGGLFAYDEEIMGWLFFH